ncbi:PHD finger protein EHD3-like isoform X2 [Glycine soja]|uniref:PHD finger protein EHD3-like isoform X2 n=1 Tax=Glycine soja TaxID=3848 RepID=UPI00103D9C08|nr:PHD finger protein EHD3-like isoform X2 [Glycine soja]
MGTEDGTSDADKTEFDERVQCLKGAAMDGGVAIVDGNCVSEEGQLLKSEAMNVGVAIADENGVAEEGRIWKSETFCNRVAVADKGDSGGVECLQTYKRRKKSSSKGEVQEQCRKNVETSTHIADQDVTKPCDVALCNTSDDCSHGQWGNIVLKHLYQSLGDGNGGIEGCIREALIHYPKHNHTTTVMETFKIDKDGQECSLQFEPLSHRTEKEANGHADVMCNGGSSESPDHGVTEMCQRVLCNVLTSEKFSSLCKALLENFQGMKPESVLDFTVMNSRMKEQAYEQSPTLFLSDIQQVWRKLQDAGNEIVALAKSLSNMSRTSYSELVGIPAQSTFQDEKQVEFDCCMKPEQTQACAMYKICSCKCCGEKADGTDCLVCDSCEEIYHVSCIEPAVKEIIPHKSWYCANCTANVIESLHENCVLCERLNDAKTLDDVIGDGSFPTIEETQNEFEENSNCTSDGIQVSIGEEKTPNCKICENEVDGGKIKICGHRFCSNKYYHVRCLTINQLKSYGHCWYCPSCLCRVCLTDQDDDRIVLCDGCDHAYHIYCMKPPRTSIPRGNWFCRKCDAGIQAIHQAKKAYEFNKPRRNGEDAAKPNANLEKKHNNKRARELESGGAMDMLLTAANTLNFEEKEAASHIKLQRT